LHLLSTINNLTNIRAHFSNLHSEDDTKLWMHKNVLKMEPPLVNLTAGRLTPVDIILTLPNQTGTYTGTMTFVSDSAVLKVIPVMIRSNVIIPVFSLIAVAVGAGVTFIVKYAKLRIKIRDEAVKALEEAEAAAFLSRTEKRVDDKYPQDDKEFQDADTFFLRGDYTQAKRIFESATKYYNSSKEDNGEANPNKQRPALTYGAMAKKVRAARATKGLRSSLRNPGNAFFFVASITLGIGIMQTYPGLFSASFFT
jgi:hypothetical protein